MNQARDKRTGQYGFDGDMSRLCVCGHPLAVHAAAAPHPCFDCDTGMKGATGSNCDCQKFRLSRKKAPKACKECGSTEFGPTCCAVIVPNNER